MDSNLWTNLKGVFYVPFCPNYQQYKLRHSGIKTWWFTKGSWLKLLATFLWVVFKFFFSSFVGYRKDSCNYSLWHTNIHLYFYGIKYCIVIYCERICELLKLHFIWFYLFLCCVTRYSILKLINVSGCSVYNIHFSAYLFLWMLHVIFFVRRLDSQCSLFLFFC